MNTSCRENNLVSTVYTCEKHQLFLHYIQCVLKVVMVFAMLFADYLRFALGNHGKDCHTRL